MQSWSSKDFTADRAWGALDIANKSRIQLSIYLILVCHSLHPGTIFCRRRLNRHNRGRDHGNLAVGPRSTVCESAGSGN